MQKVILYVVVTLCAVFNSVKAQTPLQLEVEKNVKKIEDNATNQREKLKSQVEIWQSKKDLGIISEEALRFKKDSMSAVTAKNIEDFTASELDQLTDHIRVGVQSILEYKERSTFEVTTKGVAYTSKEGKRNNRLRIVYTENGEKKICYSEARTTSQFVFAIGVDNLMTDNKLAGSDYKYMGSKFVELGTTFNTRLSKENSLLHFKYGLSFAFHKLKPTDNRYLVSQNQQTTLETFDLHLKNSKFRMVNIEIPLHLEFDFTKPIQIPDSDKKIFQSHKALRFGIGGFVGANISDVQKLQYVDNGRDVKQKIYNDPNVRPFVYGLSTYIGYKEASLYLKYNLNEVFKHNEVKQNFVSLGLRYDFN